MDSLTYSLIIGVTFLVGVFVFTYFETPRKTLNKGIKKIRNVQFLNSGNAGKKNLTIPSENKRNSGRNDKDDLRVYVHEY